jgi:hypothetical protein
VIDETTLLIIEGRRTQLATLLLAEAERAEKTSFYGVVLPPEVAREIAYLLEALP